MAIPLTTVNYRFQNVDFLSYIELPSDVALLQMRPLKDSTRQQWKFVTQGATAGSYYIQNVASPLYYMGGLYNHLSPVLLQNALQWKIEYNDGSYMLSTPSGAVDYWFYANTESEILLETSKMGYENRRWNLLPVTTTALDNDPLPTGYYRIRTYNGINLLTMPVENSVEDSVVYIQDQEPKNAYQRWSVIRQENGLYTIQNSGDSGAPYLGCGATQSAQGDPISTLSTPFFWSLRRIGSMSAFSINLPNAQLSVGFADYNATTDDGISLINSDAVPSQTWFFEKFVPLGDDRVHATRLVAEGNYVVSNCHSPGTSITYYSSELTLKYISSTSPQFVLSCATSKTETMFLVDGGGFLNVSNEPMNWVLLSENDGDPGFYICRPDAGYPRKVVTNRTVGGNEFGIDNMASGSDMQMWKFSGPT